MKHIDLFSGIGGFALAADRVFGEVEHIFCDNDEFCQQVLKKHWPQAPIISDIRRFTLNPVINEHRPESREVRETQEVQGVSQPTLDSRWVGGTDLLTGGFPCQPFSQAGRRRGTADDRYLWPEMFRVIREFKPTWVIAENVRGLVTWSDGLVLEQVCTDLESEGYEVQPLIIPACAVNAPHRRDRVWIVAYRNDSRGGTSERKTLKDGEADSEERQHSLGGVDGQGSNAPHTNFYGRRPEETSQSDERGVQDEDKSRVGVADWQQSWGQNWIEVATELCRVDDGLPRRLDRNPRLKALGNAIVPQVAEEIMRTIKYVMENEN